ncbi:tetratricopeptide repeat protein [bacterium]|nr:tetratricopeptide repeat protein [bacterium]
MAYKFLNEKLQNFLSASTGGFMFARTPDYSALKNEAILNISETTDEILSHNFDTFLKLVSFLDSSLNSFILHGFMGSGKSAIINLVPEMINSTVLYFRINCFESTNLDDVLLSIHTDFVKYHNEKKIILPKVDSNNFTERINAYIRSGNSPLLFIFDSLDSEKYSLHAEILNFIKHISQIDKIKIIVTSRNLASKDLSDDASSNFAVIKLLSKDEFIALLNKKGIESDDETYENTFIASKGHYLYISLIINVINLLNISLKSLYNDYSKKNMTIFDFLISKVLTLIPERFFKTLWFLTLIRSGVGENFLITQKLSTPDEIAYLEERMLLCREGKNIYLKDYVKQTVEGTINAQTRKDIHTYLYELYESQLPKKPSERDLTISRSTMRRESAYHKDAADNTIIEVSPVKAQNKTNIDYLSYANSIKKDWIFSESTISPKQQSQQRFVKPAPRGLETRIRNNLRAKQFELSQEELNLLNQLNMKVPTAEFVKPEIKNYNRVIQSENQEQNIRQEIVDNRQQNINSNEKYKQNYEHIDIPKTETLATVMQEARNAEQDFNYEKALAIYAKAYNMTEEAGYTDAKPIIMMQTAYCHRRMQNNDEALKCFDSANKLYETINPQKAADALFNMAEIYTETYNHSQAKSLYEKILDSNKNIDINFKIRVMLNLAEIENNNSNYDKACEYYQEVLNSATHSDNKKLLCECCFKYGLACDDYGDTEKAFKLYIRCIQTSTEPDINSFISSAYSNIAEIYEDQDEIDKAAKYYEEAAKADEKQDNWDGMYFSYSKLASIYHSKSIPKALEFALKALEAAKQLNDYVSIASVYIQAGDYYYQLSNNYEALKSYLFAKEYMLNQPNSDNIRKIDIRINNLKSKTGENLYNQIKSEIGIE